MFASMAISQNRERERERERNTSFHTAKTRFSKVLTSFSQFFIHYIGHKINNWPDVNLCFSAGAALSGAAHF
jgi:hypothetical protein